MQGFRRKICRTHKMGALYSAVPYKSKSRMHHRGIRQMSEMFICLRGSFLARLDNTMIIFYYISITDSSSNKSLILRRKLVIQPRSH